MRAARSPSRQVVLAAIAIAAVGVLAAIVFLGPMWAHRGQGRIRRMVDCLSHLDALAKAYRDARDGGRFDAKLHGSSQILSWFGEYGRPSGESTILLCPDDPDVLHPGSDDDRRADVARGPSPMRVAPGLGSYAVRDFERFPVDRASTEKQPILCDRQGDDGRTSHHEDRIVIAFEDGEVQWLSREELGVAPGDPIVVGPDSPSPLLRVFEKP